MWTNSYWGGEYWADTYWPAESSSIVEECPAFRLFKRDCELEIKGWADGGEYARVAPFGGPHFQEPSGAEI